MASPQTWTTRATQALERTQALDGVAAQLNRVIAKAARPGVARDVLSGTWIGHPLHPLLVTAPIGCWTSVSFLDLVGDRRAAQTLTGAGVLCVLPTAAAGLSDWLDTSGPERRVGFAHLAVNTLATGCYGLSWLARRRRNQGVGVLLAVVGAALASGAGWLGGHLTYALGVGVDTNAFDAPGVDWTALDIAPPAEGDVVGAAVGTTAIVVGRHGGTLMALADRCSHRGRPVVGGYRGGRLRDLPVARQSLRSRLWGGATRPGGGRPTGVRVAPGGRTDRGPSRRGTRPARELHPAGRSPLVRSAVGESWSPVEPGERG